MGQKSFLLALFLIAITYGVVHKLQLGADVAVIKKNLDKFPYAIGMWQGVDISMDEKIIRILDTDAYVFRNYATQKGDIITLYIGYYGTKKGGRSDHIPEGCYPGAGWSILTEGRSQIVIPGRRWGNPVVLNTLEVKKGDANQIVYHWYQSDRDKVIISGIQQNIHRFKNRLMLNRDDGAFVRVSMDIHNDKTMAKDELEGFIKLVFPLIADHWPQEEGVRQ